MKATFEIIRRAENGDFWLSGPISGRAIDTEIRYMHGLYPVGEVTYLPTATARQMAKAGRLLDWRNTGRGGLRGQ